MIVYWQIVRLSAEYVTFIWIVDKELIARIYSEGIQSSPLRISLSVISERALYYAVTVRFLKLLFFILTKLITKIFYPPSLPD